MTRLPEVASEVDGEGLRRLADKRLMAAKMVFSTRGTVSGDLPLKLVLVYMRVWTQRVG